MLQGSWIHAGPILFVRYQVITLSEIAFRDKFNILSSSCFYTIVGNFKIIEYICGIFLYIRYTIIKL